MTQQEISIEAREQAKVETEQLINGHNKPNSNTMLNFFAYTVLAMGFGLLMYVLYLIAWPQHPLVVNRVMVTTPVVKSPGSLTYQIDACKNVDLTPIVYRKIVQGNSGTPIPTTQGLATQGCRKTTVTIRIPAGIAPGDHYILYSDITYHINALRDVHVFWHSQEFQIIN